MALALALSLAFAPQAAVPLPMLDAFKRACFDVREYDKIADAAVAGGWARIAETDAEPRIAAILRLARDYLRTQEPGSTMTEVIFRQRFDGRDLYPIASRFVAKEGFWGNGCRAYDLDAPAAIERDRLTGWTGKPPTGVQTVGGSTKYLWEPWQDGVSLEITYVPRGDPLGASFGVQGQILTSQAIGGF